MPETERITRHVPTTFYSHENLVRVLEKLSLEDQNYVLDYINYIKYKANISGWYDGQERMAGKQ